MGRLVIQRILECGDCGRIPEDGEKMWEMCGEFICEPCIDRDESDGEEEE